MDYITAQHFCAAAALLFIAAGIFELFSHLHRVGRRAQDCFFPARPRPNPHRPTFYVGRVRHHDWHRATAKCLPYLVCLAFLFSYSLMRHSRYYAALCLIVGAGLVTAVRFERPRDA